MKCIYENCSSCIHRKDCDYLVKIKELKGQIKWLENCKSELGKILGEANKQIEKMKCCGNCKYAVFSDGICIDCGYDTRFQPLERCKNLSNWEMGE